MVYKYDYLVIGSGIAGMSYALKVAATGKVALICKTNLEEANTYFAQGGVASVTNLKVDNFDKHIEDTMIAGDWLSDRAAVEKVVKGAPEQIRQLIEWGVNFDRNEKGEFDLHREGGHSEFRILHHADNTGAEIQDSLIRALKSHPNIDVFENYFAVEIITQHHLGKIVTRRTPDITCYGAYILDLATNKVDTFLSKVTVMATGGIGQVYTTTTNPPVATGDGIAMVYRAKGTVKDMEFIQFHPTALYHPGDRPSFLITEAMRGYGAVLRTLDGKEFMQKYDKRLSLAPRDIVARAIDNEMKLRGDDHVYLDVTHKDPEETKRHFPNIYAKCLSLGIDITKDYIPVAHICKMPQFGNRHNKRLHPGSACRPLSVRWHKGRPQRLLVDTTVVRCGRMLVHRPPRRQQACIEFLDRSGGLCRCRCQTQHGKHLPLLAARRCAGMERRRHTAQRRNGAYHTKPERSEPDNEHIRRHCPL